MSGRRMQGWGESDVVQAVEALTYIYRNPIAARRRGRRAADFVQVCSERHRRSFRACIHIFTLRFTHTYISRVERFVYTRVHACKSTRTRVIPIRIVFGLVCRQT